MRGYRWYCYFCSITVSSKAAGKKTPVTSGAAVLIVYSCDVIFTWHKNYLVKNCTSRPLVSSAVYRLFLASLLSRKLLQSGSETRVGAYYCWHCDLTLSERHFYKPQRRFIITYETNLKTLAGRRGGGWCHPHRWFSYDCSRAVFDKELKFGMTDPSFKPDIMNIFPFSSSQVTALTYGIWHHMETSARSQDAATSQRCQWQAIFLRKMKLSESNKPPGSHILFTLDFSCRLSEVRSVTWPCPL